jgi:hypothetical protein
MDIFSRYCGGVEGTTRTDNVGVEQGLHATPRKRAFENSFKNLAAIQRSDQKLYTFSAGTLVASVVRPERTSSAWSRDSTLLQGKEPPETPLKIWAQYNGRIKSYRPFQLVLWSRRWYDPNGHRRHGVAILCYSKE